ncbi:hypothetical protein CVS40_4873 [Lucilia cuprina]|nr:hypothetical protein CVS40_4873 [Lucilia cuprina]
MEKENNETLEQTEELVIVESSMESSSSLLRSRLMKMMTLKMMTTLENDIMKLITTKKNATQVSVERSFSALWLIHGDLRYNLSEENLEAIMAVKLNSDNF